MATDKKPSIYSDRGGIGSADELDEYGVWVKSEPQDVSADSSKASGILEDEASGDDFGDAVLNAESSSNFADIEFPDDNIEVDSESPFSMDADLDDLNLPEGDSPGISDGEMEIEDTNFDEFETSASGDDDQQEIDIDGDFGSDDFDVQSVSEDGNFGVPTVKSIENNISSIQDDINDAVKGKDGGGDLSNHLLQKIANELASIRGELSDLKKEFSLVRGPGSEDGKSGFFNEEDDETIALTGDELDNIISNTDEEEPQASAFNLGDDDDEDEAIALTGDELDNILNSADFTEESGTNETPEEEESDFSLDDEPLGTPPEETEEDASSTEEDASSTEDDFSADFSMDDTDLSSGITDDADLGDISFGDDASSDIEIEDVDFDSAGIESDMSLEDDAFGEAASDETSEDEGEEVADINIDGLNIDLDPDTILDEQDSSEAEAPSETSDEIDFDSDLSLKDTDLSDDIFGDSSDVTDDMGITSDEIEFDEAKDSEELEKLRNDGATPVTFPPDNSSYLEDDAQTDPLDFSNAVIDEPDLSTDGISDDLVEPSENEFDLDSLSDLTIGEESPAEEDVSTSSSFEDDLDNIDIDIPSESEPAVEEAAQEDEDISFDMDSDDFGASVEAEDTPVSFEAEDTPVSFEAEDTPVSFDEDLGGDDFTSGGFDDLGISDDASVIEDSGIVEEEEAAPVAAPTPVAAPQAAEPAAGGKAVPGKEGFQIPSELKMELRNILSYMDQLLESLPEEKIEEFAKSDYFDSYKKLFKDLGLV